MTTLDRPRILPDTQDHGPTAAVWSPRARLLIAAALPLLVVAGLVLRAAGLQELSALLITVFLSGGPGAAGALLARVQQPHLFWLHAGVGSATVLVFVSLPMAWFGWWQVNWVFAVLSVTTIGLAALAVWRDRAEWGEWLVFPTAQIRLSAQVRRAARACSPTALAVAGFALAVFAAHRNAGPPRAGGMALSAGPLWFGGAAVLVLALGWAWRRGSGLIVPALALTTVVVACQAVMYREPTVIPAARHIGVAEFVIANGHLQPGKDIYQSWSGLFTSAAFTKVAAGLGSLFGYATWWAVLAAALSVLAVRALAGHFLPERRAWLAAVVFGLGNSLNTTFFAPQVFGVVVALTMFSLFLSLAKEQGKQPAEQLRLRVGRLLVLLALAIALAVVHQISPYMLILGMATLVACRLLRPWWTLLIPLVPALWWALVNLGVLSRYVSVGAFGRLFNNLQPPQHPSTTLEPSVVNTISFGVPAVALMVIGLAALLTLVTGRTRTNLALALTAGSPVLLMLGTDYGNEGIFRVALFSLPWLATLACRIGVDNPGGRPGTRIRALGNLSAPNCAVPKSAAPRPLVALAVVAIFGVNVVGLTGMDAARVLRTNDVAAVQWLEERAAPGSSVLSLGTNLATPMFASGQYDDVNYVSRELLYAERSAVYPSAHGAAYDPVTDLDQLTDSFVTDHPGGERYLLYTEANAIFNERYGLQTISDQQAMIGAADHSGRWHRIRQNTGVIIWRYTKARP